MENSSTNFPIKLFIVSSSEWKTATKHGIEKHTKSPNISRRACILYLRDDLRGHVAGCPTEDFDLAIIRNASTETKINDFERMAVSIK